MSRKSYSKEYKVSAVRMMVMDGMPASQVSQKLGVSEGLLYKWKQQQVGAMSVSDSDLDPQALVSENEQLRKQLARAEKINEILKKTVAYFAEHEKGNMHPLKKDAPQHEVALWCEVLGVSRSAYYN